MAEAQSQPKTMRIKISYRDETLSMSHHTINVIGGITDGQNGIWYTKDTTSLPVEIQITIPDYIEKEFYIIIGVENKFNEQCTYRSERQFFDIKRLSDEVQEFSVDSNDRVFLYSSNFCASFRAKSKPSTMVYSTASMIMINIKYSTKNDDIFSKRRFRCNGFV
jgi:hypothetical protein